MRLFGNDWARRRLRDATWVSLAAVLAGLVAIGSPARAGTSGCDVRTDNTFSAAYNDPFDGAYVRAGTVFSPQGFCDGIYVGHTQHCGTFRLRVFYPVVLVSGWHDSCWTAQLLAWVGPQHSVKTGYSVYVEETANAPDVAQSFWDWF